MFRVEPLRLFMKRPCEGILDTSTWQQTTGADPVHIGGGGVTEVYWATMLDNWIDVNLR